MSFGYGLSHKLTFHETMTFLIAIEFSIYLIKNTSPDYYLSPFNLLHLQV